jgi:hypothetical protein
MIFRDMNGVAEKKVETRVQILLKERKGSSPNLPDELTIAVAKFFADYCPPSDVVVSNTTVLQVLYEYPDACDCFKEALHAAALRNTANKAGLEQMEIDAERAYGRALSTVTSILKDPLRSKQDTTLATLYLLGFYEV